MHTCTHTDCRPQAERIYVKELLKIISQEVMEFEKREREKTVIKAELDSLIFESNMYAHVREGEYLKLCMKKKKKNM